MTYSSAIGVCAYNEEHNIRNLLNNLLIQQKIGLDCKIVVICSGCTDRTIEIVKEFQSIDKRIELIVEKERKGKAHALNQIFKKTKAYTDFLILVNADSLPQKGSLDILLSAIKQSNVGAVFAQSVPFQGQRGVCYGIVKSIWRLHHFISLDQNPKLSAELSVIRTKCLKPIPDFIATDEPYIELNIRKQGYEIHYLPSAIVYIRCPTNVSDLLKQRRRIWTGHLQLKNSTGFEVSTSNFRNVLRSTLRLKPTELFYTALGGFIEVVAFLQARFSSREVPYMWEPIKSTKKRIETHFEAY